MAKVTTTQNSSNWSKTTNTSTSKNGYLRTAGQKKKYNTLNNAVKKADNKVNKMLKKGFKNPYAAQLKNITNQISNKKFEYDLNADPLYQQYKEQYQSMGNQAMQEAQANATALTGGFANSYAETAGTQAYMSYMQQLQSLVPQLYGQARSDFDNDMSNLYNQANLYSGLGQQAYAEWSDKLTNAMNNRDYKYNKANNYYNTTQYQKSSNTSSTKGGSSSSTSQKKK